MFTKTGSGPIQAKFKTKLELRLGNRPAQPTQLPLNQKDG